MLPKVQQGDPATGVLHLLPPLLVVALVAGVEVQHVLADQDEPRDPLQHQVLHDVPLQEHDVVVQQVVPLADELDDREAVVVVGVEDLQVQGGGPEGVPLRVDRMVVHGVREIELAVLAAEERGQFVLLRRVAVPPVPERFDVVHGTKLGRSPGLPVRAGDPPRWPAGRCRSGAAVRWPVRSPAPARP